MTTFIKTKLNKSDDQTNIDKYRLTANIIEYYIKSKLIIFPKSMIIRQSFHIKKMYVKMSKNKMFKIYILTFWSQLASCYAFYKLYLTVSGIIPSLKLIEQF